MRCFRFLSSIVVFACFLDCTAHAGVFTAIRIGDVDGFGYGAATGFHGADGLAANRTGGVLSTGDLLPDLNRNGVLATGQGDDFDNRSAAEIANNFLTGSGYTDQGSTGSKFTDIALARSYDTSSSNNRVYNANTSSFGAGGAFPLPPSNTLPNQPGFHFDYFVAAADILAGTDVFLNLVFGDYDVTPAQVSVRFLNSTTRTLALNRQPGTQDGLIQSAFATLAFGDVYSSVAGGYRGYLDVNFVAPNEPYTAFDFAELSVNPISLIPVPEPISLTSWLLLGGFSVLRRVRRANR